MQMKLSLDLGCGQNMKNPFNAEIIYGIDCRPNSADNIRCVDLVIEPVPFESNYFDFVTAYDFLEHVPRILYTPKRKHCFVDLMNEIYRVLKPEGLFLSSTPAFPYSQAFRDPTHVNIITEETFPLYFDDKNTWAQIYGFNGRFKILQQKWEAPHLVALLQKK